jgi:hypothetical protein
VDQLQRADSSHVLRGFFSSSVPDCGTEYVFRHSAFNNRDNTDSALAFSGSLGQKARAFYRRIVHCFDPVQALLALVSYARAERCCPRSRIKHKFRGGMYSGVLYAAVFPMQDSQLELAYSVFGDIFSVLPQRVSALSGRRGHVSFLAFTAYFRGAV